VFRHGDARQPEWLAVAAPRLGQQPEELVVPAADLAPQVAEEDADQVRVHQPPQSRLAGRQRLLRNPGLSGVLLGGGVRQGLAAGDGEQDQADAEPPEEDQRCHRPVRLRVKRGSLGDIHRPGAARNRQGELPAHPRAKTGLVGAGGGSGIEQHRHGVHRAGRRGGVGHAHLQPIADVGVHPVQEQAIGAKGGVDQSRQLLPPLPNGRRGGGRPVDRHVDQKPRMLHPVGAADKVDAGRGDGGSGVAGVGHGAAAHRVGGHVITDDAAAGIGRRGHVADHQRVGWG
jgi:hypothetical protein